MRRWDSIEECLPELAGLATGGRSIRYVVLHHTLVPSHADWRGDATAASVKQYWLKRTKALKYVHPLGAHFIVAPTGSIYAPFNDLADWLNANSNATANRRGVAIETVGNFDKGKDVLGNPQRHAVMGLIGGLLVRFRLTPADLYFHRSFTDQKTCPGTSLDLSDFRAGAGPAMEWARGRVG